MLDLMYEVPGVKDIKSVVITDEVINGLAQPQIVS
jgi:ATP-dependent protease Clp ATPase subunit